MGWFTSGRGNQRHGPDPPPPRWLELADLTPPVAEYAAAASVLGPLAFVEADHAGGSGHQAAVVWRAGHVVRGARPGPINQALALLGVRRSADGDEVAALGLDGARTSAAWLAGLTGA